ncbi:MAG: hypothetical protein KatS3mg023_0133 [Armatimonadota bacterium]|nr:MAG: hypothetical protein KatS3mg023_0133 [Armatimonadota bacterium]
MQAVVQIPSCGANLQRTTSALYLQGLSLVRRNSEWHHFDPLGTAGVIANGSAQVVSRNLYDLFGGAVSTGIPFCKSDMAYHKPANEPTAFLKKEVGSVLHRLPLVLNAVCLAVCILALVAAHVRGRVLCLVRELAPGMSEHEVVQAIGLPDAVYEPSQQKEVYRMYVTKPLIPSKGQMWTYDIWM